MKQKILITGSDGFLASRLAGYYEHNYEVIRVNHTLLDITEEAEVQRFVKHADPAVVLHCAAVSDVGTCERNPKLSRRVNTDGTVNLAKACKQCKSRLVFMSSDQVYIENTGTAASKEDLILTPVNKYGKDKLLAEKLALEILPDTVCLRLTWMYDLPIRGYRTNKNLLVNLIRALLNQETITLPVYDFRGITYVWEVISNMEKAWKLPGGVYNFGSENILSTYDTAAEWLTLLAPEQKHLLIPDLDRFAGSPRNLKIDTEKISAEGIEFSDSVEGFKLCLKEYTL